jgi:hypothetical protein
VWTLNLAIAAIVTLLFAVAGFGIGWIVESELEEDVFQRKSRRLEEISEEYRTALYNWNTEN